jgi:hypothetical protein
LPAPLPQDDRLRNFDLLASQLRRRLMAGEAAAARLELAAARSPPRSPVR